MVLGYLIEKEFRQIKRNPLFIGLTIWFPIAALLLLPWAITFEVNDVRIAIVDQCVVPASHRLVEKLDASPVLLVTQRCSNYGEAIDHVAQRRVDAVITIPVDFDRRLGRGEAADLHCAISAVDGTKGLLISQVVAGVVRQYAHQLLQERGGGVAPYRVEPHFLFNPSLSYKVFMLPALVVIMMTLVCGLLAALNIVQEKEQGTIYQINVTPVGRFEFILAKIIPYWIMGAIIFTIGLALLGFVYGLWPLGSVLLLYLCTGVYIVTISGVGIVVSNYSSSLQQAMFLILFYVLILFLISGLFTAVETMPAWAQVVAYLNPLTYYVELLRALYLRGALLSDLAQPLLILSGFAIGANLWAVFSYKKVG